MCELDIQQTADERLIVMHDDTLKRTTNGAGNLWEKALAELQRYDAGLWYDKKFSGEAPRLWSRSSRSRAAK